MIDTSDLISSCVRDHCTPEERSIVALACSTAAERVKDIYAAELRGTPMCCRLHTAKKFLDVRKRALQAPS